MYQAPAGATWQAPTLALFLILLAFFIILGQMSQVQGQKFKAMRHSVQTALNGLPLDTNNSLASGGIDPQSASAIQDIVAVAYNDITNISKNNWDMLMVRQEKIVNALDITLNAPAVLLDDTSPYPPEQRLSGILVGKMLAYQTPFFNWHLRVTAAPSANPAEQIIMSQGLGRFARALISRGLKPSQVHIAFNVSVPKNTIQLYLVPQVRDK
jgi:hypothetical protein